MLLTNTVSLNRYFVYIILAPSFNILRPDQYIFWENIESTNDHVNLFEGYQPNFKKHIYILNEMASFFWL